MEASASPQQAWVTLRISTELHVEHIEAFIEVEGPAPWINRLYDWQRMDDEPPNSVDVHQNKDGHWYWEYAAPHWRPAGSRITVGVEFVAPQPCNTYLVFRVTTQDKPGDSSGPPAVGRLAMNVVPEPPRIES